jgi:hypothetical protein
MAGRREFFDPEFYPIDDRKWKGIIRAGALVLGMYGPLDVKPECIETETQEERKEKSKPRNRICRTIKARPRKPKTLLLQHYPSESVRHDGHWT